MMTCYPWESREDPQEETHYWEIENKDVVVIPSLSLDSFELEHAPVEGVSHYEERMLYVLLALCKKDTRIIIITSNPLDQGILEYYLGLIPEEMRKSARSRVLFMSVCDEDIKHSLCEKICQRPRLLKRLKSLIHPNATVLNVLVGAKYEIFIAKYLKIPLYSALPSDQVWGTKSGSRRIFKQVNIPCADGTYESIYDVDGLVTQIIQVALRNPSAKKGLVKLNDGFSGFGNAIIDLMPIQELNTIFINSDDFDLRQVTLTALETMNFCKPGRDWPEFLYEIKRLGCVFELFVEGMYVTSPSVQLVVNEDLTVTTLSTHEQILDGQVYLGCKFPANESYRAKLMEYGRLVGDFFSSQAITDHFSVDFICVKSSEEDDWNIYALEINLRITGTTHPFMTMKLLTHGNTDEKTGLYYSNKQEEKYYVASDNIKNKNLKHFVPLDIKDIFDSRPELNWCPKRQTGVCCHLLGCVSENGKIGMTSIANSPEDAEQQFKEAVSLLEIESFTSDLSLENFTDQMMKPNLEQCDRKNLDYVA